jgi:hypothetical protein
VEGRVSGLEGAERLVAPGPALCYSGTGRRADTESRSGVEIVGREAELAVLDAFLGSGPPSGAVILTGGPGIGKTTL